jgi:hypothetical protein
MHFCFMIDSICDGPRSRVEQISKFWRRQFELKRRQFELKRRQFELKRRLSKRFPVPSAWLLAARFCAKNKEGVEE